MPAFNYSASDSDLKSLPPSELVSDIAKIIGLIVGRRFDLSTEKDRKSVV